MKPEKENLSDILDKMLELRKSEDSYNWMQKAICIFAGIAALIVISFLCVMMYKNNFSIESLLSLLLAFFSIFISVFFYFKASDTSNDFYDKSYDIMKDVSVTLGKIEAQFGEKLNNMNEKLGHLSHAEAEKTEELENVEDAKQKMIDELLEKAKYNDDEKAKFLEKLQNKERETELLKKQLSRLEMERFRLSERNLSSNEFSYTDRMQKLLNVCSKKDIYALLEGDYKNITSRTRMMMRELGMEVEDFYNNDELMFMLKRKMRNLESNNNNENAN